MAAKFVIAYSKATGRKRRVPDYFIGHPKLGRNLELAPSQRDALNELPEGDPDKSWTVKQLETYAGNHGIDLAGVTKKDDILAAIAAEPETSEPSPGADETPATGDTKE